MTSSICQINLPEGELDGSFANDEGILTLESPNMGNIVKGDKRLSSEYLTLPFEI